MGPFETILVDDRVAACNGGGGALGHPRVFLNLGPDGRIECPYCSRLFVLRGKAGDGRIAGIPAIASGAHPPPGASAKP
jgi:uncharacterized Zn-finger protein